MQMKMWNEAIRTNLIDAPIIMNLFVTQII